MFTDGSSAGIKNMEAANMETKSEWKGSTRTAAMVAQEIGQRWGSDEVKNYDPQKNCFTYKRWQQEGYQVKKGEKAIRSVTWIGDDEDENARKFPKTVCLFYIKQVELTKKAEKMNQFLNSPEAGIAHVGSTIADAFGMRGLPNVVVHDEPGCKVMEFGFAPEVK